MQGDVQAMRDLADAEALEPAQVNGAIEALRIVEGCATLVDRFRTAIRKTERATRPERRARMRAARASVLAEVEPEVVEVPGVGEYLLPDGYGVVDDRLGQWKTVEGAHVFAELAPRGIYVVGIGVHPASGEHYVDLTWPLLDSGRWVQRTVPREVIADSRKLPPLAGLGAAITTDNAQRLVRFLARFEEVNADRIERRVIVNAMGWAEIADDRRVIVVGHDVIGAEPGEVELLPMEGAEQIVSGWRCSGSESAWRDAVSEPIAKYPVAGLFYLQSLGSLLLDPLGVPPHASDLSGATSHGKSTVERLAASVWGDPSDAGGVFATWDGTETGLERLLATVGTLPLFLDESQTAGGPNRADAVRMLYRVSAGQGKMRGSTIGLRERARWRCLVLSTGESPIVSISEAAGTRGRVLTIEEQPFGPKSEAGAELTRDLTAALLEHHGHAGRIFAKHLLTVPRDELRQRYKQRCVELRADADPGVGDRLATYGGIVLLAHELAEEVGLPVPPIEPLMELLKNVIKAGSEDADRPLAAMRDLLSWAGSQSGRMSNPEASKYDGDKEYEQRIPPGGWLGFWDHDREGVAIVSTEARAQLRRMEYDDAAVTREWVLRDWLLLDSAGKSTRPVTMPEGTKSRCLVIPWEIVDAVLGDGGEPD